MTSLSEHESIESGAQRLCSARDKMPLLDETFSQDMKCKCERPMHVIHCIACGSYAIEKKRRAVTATLVMEDGSEKKFSVPMFVCRRCGCGFDDTKRLRCQARPTPMSVKAQRVLDSTQDELTKIKNDDKLSYDEKKVQLFNFLAKLRKPKTNGKPLSTEINELPSEDKTGLDEVKGDVDNDKPQ